MGKATGTTRTVSEVGLPEKQQRYLDTVLSEAERLYSSPGPGLYPGQWVAGFTQPELAAQAGVLGAASQPLRQISDAATQAYMFNLTAGRDPTNNPYFARTLDAITRPVFQQLTEQVLPNIRAEAIGSGGFGGTRQGLAEALATERATRAAFDAAAQFGSNAYSLGQQLALETLRSSPIVTDTVLEPFRAMAGVGAQQRSYEQALIDQARQMYEYEQALPYRKLVEFANIATRPYGSRGESTVIAPEGGGATQVMGWVAALLALLRQFGIVR